MQAIYFEDLQKTRFVIKVKHLEACYLEQREWHKNDYHYTPDDEFTRHKECNPTPEESYAWIAARSDLMGVSVDTEKWMDRVWHNGSHAAQIMVDNMRPLHLRDLPAASDSQLNDKFKALSTAYNQVASRE